MYGHFICFWESAVMDGCECDDEESMLFVFNCSREEELVVGSIGGTVWEDWKGVIPLLCEWELESLWVTLSVWWDWGWSTEGVRRLLSREELLCGTLSLTLFSSFCTFLSSSVLEDVLREVTKKLWYITSCWWIIVEGRGIWQKDRNEKSVLSGNSW